MNNAAVFSFVKTYDNSIVASVRLARFLRDLLQLPLYDKGEIVPENLDVLLIINGAYAFAGKDTLAMLGRAIETARRVIWVQQDYTIIPPKDESGAESPFRKAFRNRRASGAAPVDYWTTCEVYATPGRTRTGHIAGPGSRYVNWNLLAFSDMHRYPVEDRDHKDSMIYYGSFRQNRVASFEKYLRSPIVRTVISCPNDKFLMNGYVGDNIRHVGKLERLESLSHYGLGLYLEDAKSHNEFHSPANRFYEMLSAGLGMVFEPDAMRMMARAQIELSGFVLWNKDDAPAMLSRSQEIADQQNELWFKQCHEQRRLLPEQVGELWTNYVRNL